MRRYNSLSWATLFLVFALVPTSCTQAQAISVRSHDRGVAVMVGEELFTNYLVRSGTKPVLWPINGPQGQAMTRAYPMDLPGEHEERDHIHHRSCWFAYEGINGIDFWHEPEMSVKRHYPIGSVEHREFVRADSDGRRATVATRNDYLDPAGKVVAKDERMYVFSASANSRTIDAKITLWSDHGPLVLGDTKEGMFAWRVPGTMKVDEKLGGQITAADGSTNAKAWGRPNEWVDYSGPVDGKTTGVTIFSHPSNHNPKPCWHVRPYGLFAANPIGSKPYGQQSTGGIQLKQGEPLTLRFRVWLHEGNAEQVDLAAEFKRYAASK